jgi:GGDEF domain-containing protein
MDMETRGARGRIGDIASPAPMLGPDAPFRRLMQLFETRRASDAVVLAVAGVPSGLIMRSRLAQEMSRPFAGNRLEGRLAAHLSSANPLVVDCEAHLDAVSRLATSRSGGERYDDIVVVRDGKLVGTVSIARLLDAVTDHRLSSASHANPLTGLPGHPVIEEWLRETLRTRESAALVRFDIDSLRTFNELYGFHQGDRAIRLAADLISSEIAQTSGGSGHLGHVGSDDFIAVVGADAAEALTRSLPAMFRERARLLYPPEDRARGYIVRRVERNQIRSAPLMSLTVAHVRVPAGTHHHYAALLDLLSDAQQLARARSRGMQENEMREHGSTQLTPEVKTVRSPTPSAA